MKLKLKFWVRTPRRNVQDTLNKLPGTSREVYLYLRERGITGKWGEPWMCPIARYLNAEGFPHVSVGTRNVTVWKEPERKTVLANVDSPKGVVEFVTDFDKFVYPAIIEVA